MTDVGVPRLETWYRRYNELCNQHRFDELADYVHRDVQVNGERQGLDDYVAGLEAVVAAFPDYRWDLRHLLVDGDWIAAHFELFAGVPVSVYAAAVPWYERLFGSPPTFLAHATEAVWELDEHRFLYVEEDRARAGHAIVTLFVDDLDAWVAGITERGLDPAVRETYGNGVRKVTYRDADGNEVGFGGAPLEHG